MIYIYVYIYIYIYIYSYICIKSEGLQARQDEAEGLESGAVPPAYDLRQQKPGCEAGEVCDQQNCSSSRWTAGAGAGGAGMENQMIIWWGYSHDGVSMVLYIYIYVYYGE